MKLSPRPQGFRVVAGPREDDVSPSGKKGRHALALSVGKLTPTKLGFRASASGFLGIKRTGASPAKVGRPRGRRSGPVAQRCLNPEVEAELRLTVAELAARARSDKEPATEASGSGVDMGLEVDLAGSGEEVGLEPDLAASGMGLDDEADGE